MEIRQEDSVIASKRQAEDSPPGGSVTLSSSRAWLYLVWLTMQRQARARQMVLIALGLLVFVTIFTALNTVAGRWDVRNWNYPRRGPTYQEWIDHLARDTSIGSPSGTAISAAFVASSRAAMDYHSGFPVFARWVVYSWFVSFLLPIWSLSFATEALGGERESRSLVWLLSRPLSRPAIYLAKFVALLPWALGLNLGGFGLLCLAGGQAGRQAFELFWPAVAAATVVFCALFHLMSAVFRRPAVMAIVYSFFLETILGSMPGYMKRVSIGFYTRCLMFDAASTQGVVPPEKPSIYLPVDPTTAWATLAGAAVVLLTVGMMVFTRSEYWEAI